MCVLIFFGICSLGWYPTTRSASRPFLNRIIVGIERTPKRPAVIGFASTSSLAIFTFSPCSFAISSSTGATIRQGPHQAAQKSTSTGVSDLMTSVSKFWSLTTCGLPMDSLLLPPKRQLLAGLFHLRRQAQDRLEQVQRHIRPRRPRS